MSKEAKEYKEDGLSEEKKADLKKKGFEKWLAYLLIKGSDQTKYGSLLKGLNAQYSLETDQFPKTLVVATDALTNHRFDQKFYDNMKKNKDKVKTEEKTEKEEDKKQETSFSQGTLKCYCCGAKGHRSNKCDKKDKIP